MTRLEIYGLVAPVLLGAFGLLVLFITRDDGRAPLESRPHPVVE